MSASAASRRSTISSAVRSAVGQHAAGVLDVDAHCLALLHDLKLLVLQHGLAAGEGLQLVLQLRRLARADARAREERVVAVGAGAHALDVALQTADVAVEVTRRGLHLDDLVLRRAHGGLGLG